MKKLSLTAAAALLAIGISGCGEGQTSEIYNNATANHMGPDFNQPVKHIGSKYRSLTKKDFALSEIEWEYDNLEGLKMHVGDKYLYLRFSHNINTQNIQFFIDADNNPKTGNREEDGADYMVENGTLYVSQSRNKWDWKELGDIPCVVEDGNSDTVAIPLKMLKNKNVVFKANAEALDSRWVPQVMSPEDGGMSVYTAKHHIDWEDVAPYTKKSDKTLKVFSTADNIYLHLEAKKFPTHIQLYIDTDNNPATGYKNDSWKNFGADYLAEDGVLYRYTGQGDWGWEDVDFINKLRSSSDRAMLDVTIPKTLINNLSEKIKIGAELNNRAWTNTRLLPKGIVPDFALTPGISPDTHIEISEVMAANTHTILDPDYFGFSDWIELHNPGNSPADIGGYQLSDKLNKPKWTIPERTVIPANGYILIWADEKNKKKKALHTNFKFKNSGEAVALFDKSGKTVDSFEFLKQLPDISVTYKNSKEVYMDPTPGKSSKNYSKDAIQSDPVTFSLEEGFYNSPQTLSMNAKGEIRYTTDGSIPDAGSFKYTQPITIDKTMSVRAISLEEGKFPSRVTTGSYIYNENISLPVVSIVTDNKYLYDDNIGIYVIGTNGKKPEDCGDEFNGKANFFQKWERPAHMTFFDNRKPVLSQDIGIKIAGECSKIYAQRSFHLKTDDKYGKEGFKYQVFRDKNIKKFSRLKLKNAGQDYLMAHMRDILATELAKGLNVAYEAYRPAVAFVNGEYFGVYNLREKAGKEYVEENFGVKKIDFIEDGLNVKEGSSESYEEEVIEYLRTHSLISNENYDHIASVIDIDNYIDYMITNIYVGNEDWPGSNIYYWKPKKEGTKWKWILHDMDYSFGIYTSGSADYNVIEKLTTVEGDDVWPNPGWSTLLFRKLIENQDFKMKFKKRFLNLLLTKFSAGTVTGAIDRIAQQIDPQMQRHIAKWNVNDPLNYEVFSKEDWREEIQHLKNFARNRPAAILKQLSNL